MRRVSNRSSILALVAATGIVLFAACASDGNFDCPPGHSSCKEGDKISDRLTCPPGGLGVADFEGVSIADQMAYYGSYGCTKPQICPDQGGMVGAYPIDPKAEPTEATFLLTNCTAGKEKLVIEKVVVYGDSRCYFTDVADNDIKEKSIIPGSYTAVRTTYKPTQPGEDHAELRVYSNAENYPVLRIRVCSTAFIETEEPDPATIPDGGAPPAASDAGGPAAIQCKAQEQRTSKCHSDPPAGSTPSGDAGAGDAA